MYKKISILIVLMLLSVGLSACNDVEEINEEMYTYQSFMVTTELEFLKEIRATLQDENLSLEEKVDRTYKKYSGDYASLHENSKIKILYIQDDYYAKILILEPSVSYEWLENNKEVWTLKENLYDILYTVEE